MKEMVDFTENAQSVEAHLNIMQSVIQRMAGNSAACKTWCITIVSAILVVVADKGKPELIWIALIPTLLFLVLDTYYLAMEKRFRNSYDGFVQRLHRNELRVSELYVVSPEGRWSQTVAKALVSVSVWPFYGALIVVIFLARVLVV
jgi:hypothetical protein